MNIGKRGCLLVASRARKTGFEIQWEKIVGEETRGLHTTSHAQPPQGDGRERKISNAPYSAAAGGKCSCRLSKATEGVIGDIAP